MSGATLHYLCAGLRWRPQILLPVIVICSLLAGAPIDRAAAADWPSGPPVLRGSVAPDFIRWDCWQFDILAGYTNLDLPGGNTVNGPVFGGFLGYNFQWDQLVIGFDIGYKYASVLDFSTATTHFKLVDYVPARARAGYAIGTFLPYALVGVAVGRFNYGDFVAGQNERFSMPGFSPALAWIGRSHPASLSVPSGNTSHLRPWAVRSPRSIPASSASACGSSNPLTLSSALQSRWPDRES
jgi:opacity protein-like surface antigen